MDRRYRLSEPRGGAHSRGGHRSDTCVIAPAPPPSPALYRAAVQSDDGVSVGRQVRTGCLTTTSAPQSRTDAAVV